jgi:hypothetical protein
MGHPKLVLKRLVESMEDRLDVETAILVMEDCGRQCARGTAAKVVKELGDKAGALDPEDLGSLQALVDTLNRLGVAGGHLQVEGKTVYGTYVKCYCPARRDGAIDSRLYCNCTRGWAKEVFGKASGRPVQVDLLKAIGWGDDECLFAVHF